MSLSLFTRRRPSGDNGAVAVVVALCSVLLLGMGALVVDIGNGWSRKRMAQTDADMAALAGAAYLPDQTTALSKAYQYLYDNLPRSDNGADIGPLSNFSDGDLNNGEIQFPTTTRITVYVPRRQVNFGLAGAIGINSTSVGATATAEIRSPKKMLPFFLNANCNLGTQIIKNPAPGQQEPDPNWPTPVGKPKTRPSVGSYTLDPTPIYEGSIPANETFTADGANFSPAPGATQVVFIRGSRSEPALSVTVTATTHLTAIVPQDLVAGTWYVAVFTPTGDWSAESGAPKFDVLQSQTNCGQSSTGDFGLIDSPRLDVSNTSNSVLLDLNLSYGVDHTIQCFQYSTTQDCRIDGAATYPLPAPTKQNCEVTPQQPVPGGVYDNDPTQAYANCLDIDNGLGPSALTQGLITGGTDAGKSFDGRFTKNTSTGCPAPLLSTNPVNRLGKSINNDMLSCYLANGGTMLQLGRPNPPDNILSAKIFDSPRFFFVPILNANVQPQNGFYPVIEWRGAFVTDETQFSVGNSIVPGDATTDNGVTTTNAKITSLTVYAFKLNALPSDGLANNGGTLPYLGGGPKIPVLID